MVAVVEGQGMKPHILYGVERTVIAAVGPEREGMKEFFEQGRGVDEVLPILAPYKIASRELKKEPTVIQAGSLTVGSSTTLTNVVGDGVRLLNTTGALQFSTLDIFNSTGTGLLVDTTGLGTTFSISSESTSTGSKPAPLSLPASSRAAP